MKEKNTKKPRLPRRVADDNVGLPITVPVTRACSAAVGNTYNWEQVLRVLGKNTKLITGIALLIILLVIAYAFHLKDIYAPVARLQIDPPGSTSLSPREQDTIADDTQEYLETQSQILQSDELATRVIRSMHLDQNQEIVGAKNFAKYGNSTKLAPRESQPTSADNSLEQQFSAAERTPLETIALNNLRKSLSVGVVRGSRLVEVSYACSNPRLARNITNNLVSEFIDQNFKTRYITTMQASEWLLGQLSDLRKNVEESNQAVVAYQKQNGLIEEDEKDGPTSQLASGISHQLAEAQADRIQTEAYVIMIDSGQAESLPQVQQSQVYQNVTTQFAETSAKLAQAKAIYGEENNNYKKLQNEVNELAAQRDAEKRRIVSQIRTAHAAAEKRERLMNASMGRLKAQMGDVNERMVRYHVLKDESKANADLYNTLLSRLKEAGLYAGLRSSNIRVVDPASVLDRPTAPKRSLIIAVGTLLAPVFAVVVAFMRESLNNTIRTPDDVEEWIGLPSLAMVPMLLPDTENFRPGIGQQQRPRGIFGWNLGALESSTRLPQLIVMQSHSMEAEAFRELRTSLLFSTSEDEAPRAILVTSAAAGEGKSTVALHLADSLAQLGKTCLIDADLRQPVISRVFNISPSLSWPNVLSGSITLEKALTRVRESVDLWVLPVGPSPIDPGELISSGDMKKLMDVLRTKFDFIVIDSPPAIPFSDARVLSLLVDGTVLVGRCGLTTRRALTRCANCLRALGAPILGVVINAMDFSAPDYRYYNFGHGSARLHGYYPKMNEVEPSQPSAEDASNAKGVGA